MNSLTAIALAVVATVTVIASAIVAVNGADSTALVAIAATAVGALGGAMLPRSGQ